MYEDQEKTNARLGWLTSIKPESDYVRVEFENQKGIRAIPYKMLSKNYLELGINESGLEKNNSHWGVKDIDLIQSLYRARLITASAVNKMEKHIVLSPSSNLKGAFKVRDIKIAFDKAKLRLQDDPAGAITLARSLLETVCKHILDGMKVSYEQGAELSDIYRKTAEVLKLAPSEDTEETLKKIMRGCISIVEGLGTLRNKLGDAHGRSIDSAKPEIRHARFAVNLAVGTASYFLETFEDINSGG